MKKEDATRNSSEHEACVVPNLFRNEMVVSLHIKFANITFLFLLSWVKETS